MAVEHKFDWSEHSSDPDTGISYRQAPSAIQNVLDKLKKRPPQGGQMPVLGKRNGAVPGDAPGSSAELSVLLDNLIEFADIKYPEAVLKSSWRKWKKPLTFKGKIEKKLRRADWDIGKNAVSIDPTADLHPNRYISRAEDNARKARLGMLSSLDDLIQFAEGFSPELLRGVYGKARRAINPAIAGPSRMAAGMATGGAPSTNVLGRFAQARVGVNPGISRPVGGAAGMATGGAGASNRFGDFLSRMKAMGSSSAPQASSLAGYDAQAAVRAPWYSTTAGKLGIGAGAGALGAGYALSGIPRPQRQQYSALGKLIRFQNDPSSGYKSWTTNTGEQRQDYIMGPDEWAEYLKKKKAAQGNRSTTNFDWKTPEEEQDEANQRRGGLFNVFTKLKKAGMGQSTFGSRNKLIEFQRASEQFGQFSPEAGAAPDPNAMVKTYRIAPNQPGMQPNAHPQGPGIGESAGLAVLGGAGGAAGGHLGKVAIQKISKALKKAKFKKG